MSKTAYATIHSGDLALMEHLREQGVRGSSISEIGEFLGVTENAVRQRITRLIENGHIERHEARSDGTRGRPGYVFKMTPKGAALFASDDPAASALLGMLGRVIRSASDQGDAAGARAIKAALVRALVEEWGDIPATMGLAERMRLLGDRIAARGLSVEVTSDGDGWVLRQRACPYGDLAKQDPGICEIEREALSKMLGTATRLKSCLAEGEGCCEFATGRSA